MWTIPPERMKTGKTHRVPLSDTALAVLAEARALATRHEDRVFPSRHAGKHKQLGQTALARVLEDLRVEATAHGFRSTFRDWAEEATAFPHEVKEAALAHVIPNKVEAAYRRGDLLDQRRPLMDAWARFATGGSNVVHSKFAQGQGVR